MADKTKHVGDSLRITGYFTDEAGQLVDPDIVLAQIKSPSGSLTEYVFGVDTELVRDSVGVYHFLIELTEPNNWFYRLYGEGAGGSAANEGTAYVERSAFA